MRFVCVAGQAGARTPREIELWRWLVLLGQAWTQWCAMGEDDRPPGSGATADAGRPFFVFLPKGHHQDAFSIGYQS